MEPARCSFLPPARFAGSPFAVQIAGRGDVPVTARAVAVNLTAVDASGPGFATLYPCGGSVPKASHVNYVDAGAVANGAIVPLDGHGRVCLFTKTEAQFVLDVNGYVPGSAPAIGIEPARYLDTRAADGNPTFDGQSQATGRVAAQSSVRVQIAGRGGVPAEAVAAIVNVTVVDPSAAGFLTVYPCTDTVPRTSTVNYVAGETVPNGAVADLAGDGSLCVFSRAEADVIVDVTGYLPGDAASVRTAVPVRMFDSRAGEPIVDGVSTGARLGAGDVVEIQVAGGPVFRATPGPGSSTSPQSARTGPAMSRCSRAGATDRWPRT